MNIAEYFINRRLLSWIIILASLAFGYSAYENMPRLEDPEFLIREAQIVTEYPGASPQEVTDEVSDILESEIQGMQEISKITATSYFGYSIIKVEVKHTFSKTRKELNSVWTRLRGKIDNASQSLPSGAGKPFVNDDYGDVFGLLYFVTGKGYTIQELEEYAKDLRKDLLSVGGVAKVSLMGEQQEVISIEISRDRAAALGVSIAGVLSSLSQQNAMVSAGNIRIGDQRLTIYPTGKLDSVNDIKQVMVSVPNANDLVRIGDIATVNRQEAEPTSLYARFNGEPSIAIGISNVSGANIAVIGEQIRAKLNETSANRPLGIVVNEFYHQGDIVNEAVDSFAINVLLAILIVLGTLFIFMGFQSAIIIGAVLGIIIAATVATIDMMGIPMHRISLGALIIALGMLVDNAIVITEGILIGVRSGRSVTQSANDVVGKTKWALLGGTIVGIIAFAPIGFAPGDTAEYTNHLFWVILISLSYSWIFAIGLVPMLADIIFPKPKNNGDSNGPNPMPESKLMQGYKRFMHQVLTFRWAVIFAAISMFAAALWGLTYVKEGFFPTSTTPQIAIDYWLPEGTDISVSKKDILEIEQEIQNYDGITGMHSVIGSGSLRYMLIYSPELPNSAYSQIILSIDSLEKIDGLITKIQSFLDNQYPNAQARVWRFRLGPSQGSKIEATFYGPDPKVLRQLAQQASDIMARTPEATAIKTNWRQQVPVVRPEYDAGRGGRLGVSREDFASAFNDNFSGKTVGLYREEDRRLPIIFRAPENERGDVSMAQGIQVPSQLTGSTVPLSESMRGLDIQWMDGQMQRENRVWTLKVQADPIPNVIASDLLNILRPQIEAISLPSGYYLRWDGEYGDSEKANAELATTLPLGLLAMVLVVVLLFNAIRQAAIIWLIVPLAIIGVVVGLLATNTQLEFMGLLGLLSLSGLLIKNAIVLVDQMDDEIKEGKPRYDAIIDSAASRVRPVMMGSLTTVLGVIPLVWDVFFASMAVVIAFGLTFATVLTLVLLPAIYAVFFNIQRHETARANKTGISS
ncbi:efflux RND transporter permease subunit [Pseudoalteromonas luteoviolacea]|uniref:efflux RND transporter permease subunit n=1 Tax=Pseudoalteromonas luteoviolacea TaxID=43657 RepID=UPI001B39AC5F|nr:efflux RND transporter permease subunit [Pseudoalteromonas luteoviolacea]MBQ4810571.1 efflux RND transporter permease subunit [Pseudoalteromonas luteoviolacea]